MHEINYIDKSFNPQSAGSYEISIQANQNGLAYCIFDPSSNSFVVFRKHRFEHVVLTGDLIRKVQAVLDNDEILGLKFHKVLFLGFTQQATLIPEAFFDRDQMVDYLRFTIGDQTDHALFNNPVIPPGLFNVFALPEALVSQITLHFKKAEFLNQTTPFLRHIANQPAALISPTVFMSLNPGFFDIACVGYGKLILYNTFQYANENDLLYYTLFALKQVGFAPEKTAVKLSGEFSIRSTYFEIIRQYIPETVMDDAVCMPILAPGLKSLPVPRFLNLLNLQMCVSSGDYIKAVK
jgi:hypothetical protein